MDDDKIIAQEALMKVLRENFQELTRFDGVTSAGIGLRMKKGEFTDELCIYVEVLEKLPPSALREGQMIPPSVAGVPVDVVERPERLLEILAVSVEELVNQEEVRPLQGGYQITNGIESGGTVDVGTLGAMIYVPDKKNPYVGLMSNHHVMFARGAGPGQPIGQPWGNQTVGVLVNGIKDSELDFAVAKMVESVAATNTVRFIGVLNGFGGAVVGMRVRKCGRTTDLTIGQITKVGIWCDEVTCVFTGLEMVQGWPQRDPSQRFSAHGDSGSVVVDDSNRVVGLHYAGTQSAPFTSFSNDIRRVRQRVGEFQIPIPYATQMVQLLDDVERLARCRSELDRTEQGRAILTAFVENVDEGIHLVNSNRACMVAWQRFKGPSFISLRKGMDEDEPYLLRKEIDGVTLDDMLTTMHRLFIEHGSPRMGEALRRYGAQMIQFVRDHDSVEEVVKMASAQPE